MSKADDRAFLLKSHTRFQDRIAALKAKATRTDAEKERLNLAIEGAQFCEKELDGLGKFEG